MAKIKLIVIICLVTVSYVTAQEPVHNYGYLKIHDDGAVGFHNDFINDGISDDNQGLAGFFSDQSIEISGAFRPVFKDMEVLVVQNLFLQVGVGITNNTNFIMGDIITPRDQFDISLDYINQAFYSGDTDLTKVDGYAKLSTKQSFVFPVGYGNYLRPLEILGETVIENAKSAYFFENPNNASTFNTIFDTDAFETDLTAISTLEFWHVDSSVPAKVRLTWNAQSEIENLVSDIENLRVVGWNIENQKWENLGNIAVDGNLTEGHLTSQTFIPDAYGVVTFGSGFSNEDITFGNYLVSPNGDGVNDFLFFKEIALSPNNMLRIFNRWGREVYRANNYSNLFDGKANVSSVVKKNTVLPAGVYFYTIELYDLELTHQGYLYLNN